TRGRGWRHDRGTIPVAVPVRPPVLDGGLDPDPGNLLPEPLGLAIPPHVPELLDDVVLGELLTPVLQELPEGLDPEERGVVVITRKLLEQADIRVLFGFGQELFQALFDGARRAGLRGSLMLLVKTVPLGLIDHGPPLVIFEGGNKNNAGLIADLLDEGLVLQELRVFNVGDEALGFLFEGNGP